MAKKKHESQHIIHQKTKQLERTQLPGKSTSKSYVLFRTGDLRTSTACYTQRLPAKTASNARPNSRAQSISSPVSSRAFRRLPNQATWPSGRIKTASAPAAANASPRFPSPSSTAHRQHQTRPSAILVVKAKLAAPTRPNRRLYGTNRPALC